MSFQEKVIYLRDKLFEPILNFLKELSVIRQIAKKRFKKLWPKIVFILKLWMKNLGQIISALYLFTGTRLTY